MNLELKWRCNHERCAGRIGENENCTSDQMCKLLKMSYVLIEVFGLTDKQVQEIERNDGLTNADLEAQ